MYQENLMIVVDRYVLGRVLRYKIIAKKTLTGTCPVPPKRDRKGQVD
jgi:hypothetical protein